MDMNLILILSDLLIGLFSKKGTPFTLAVWIMDDGQVMD